MAADSYAEANSKQGRMLGRMAELDQRLGTEVDRSAAVVAAGRRNLDEIKQWVQDAASAVPPGADREQTLLPITRKGIGDVADVVKRTNGDLSAIGARIRTIGNEFHGLGQPNDGDAADEPGVSTALPVKPAPPWPHGDVPIQKNPGELGPPPLAYIPPGSNPGEYSGPTDSKVPYTEYPPGSGTWWPDYRPPPIGTTQP